MKVSVEFKRALETEIKRLRKQEVSVDLKTGAQVTNALRSFKRAQEALSEAISALDTATKLTDEPDALQMLQDAGRSTKRIISNLVKLGDSVRRWV